MTIYIQEIGAQELAVYARVPIAFSVETIFRAEVVDGGLGGIRLIEEPVGKPYVKDYDAYEDAIGWSNSMYAIGGSSWQ